MPEVPAAATVPEPESPPPKERPNHTAVWSPSSPSWPNSPATRDPAAIAVGRESPNLLRLGASEVEALRPRGGAGGCGCKAIFLDYDGTLREFEARPELAIPTEEIQRLLAAMNAREDLAIYIISGRDAKFLSSHFGVHRGITLIAEHERRVAGRFQIWNPAAEGWMHRDITLSPKVNDDWKSPVRREIDSTVATVSGSHVEEKATSLVWHYREVVDEDLGSATAASLGARLERLKSDKNIDDVEISFGHKIVEVSCRHVTKGVVLRQICEDKAAAGEPFEMVIVAGDDISDESMFEAAATTENSLTIKVGQAATLAKYRVDNPKQLRDFLWQIVA